MNRDLPQAGKPVQLRHLPRAEAVLAAAVGSARWATIEVDGATLDVFLEPVVGVPQDELARGRLTLHTDHGRLDLVPGAPLLRLLTGIDLPEEADDAAMRWLLVDTAAARLPAPWRELFALKSVEYGVVAAGVAPLGLRVHAREAAWSVAACVRAEPQVLFALLTSGAWEGPASAAGVAESRLAVRRAVVLGEATLSHAELRSLALGDAVLIERVHFEPDGQGSVAFGAQRMHGRLVAHSEALFFEFERWSEHMEMQDDGTPDDEQPLAGDPGEDEALSQHELQSLLADDEGQGPPGQEPGEDIAMSLPAQDASPEQAAALPVQATSPASLDRLPIRLSFEVGAIDMPLAALRRLAPGGVIELQRPLPPQVQVRCRGALVARGELIDLGGGLAVQITHLEP